jgi:hypothetical protein
MVELWCDADRAHAFVKTDHDVIASTVGVRSVIADRLRDKPSAIHVVDRTDQVDRDLLNAFGILGGLVGERGGSPTLASAIVDGAIDALFTTGEAPRGGSWVLPARAALAEAFARARQEAVRAEASVRWEYPGCAVGVDEGTVAIAAGYPDDDDDALCAWASRVAHRVALAGVRRAIVSGSEAAEAALSDALGIAGIERVRRPPPLAPTIPRCK